MSDPSLSMFFPVSVSTLQPLDSAGINLYQSENDGAEFVLYCADDHPLSREDLDRLRERGVTRLFIESDSRSSYQSYLRSLIDDGADGPQASLSVRAGALNDVVRDALETTFAAGDTDETVEETTRLGGAIAEIVCDDQFAASDLCRVLHHDYATFTHSANVAFYSSIIASEMGCSRDEVQMIATGGLLHDLGKLAIDEKILCKPGRLTDEEFRVIKTHPTLGFDQLNFRDDLTFGQLMMVYQHHERVDGGGYPVGLVGEEIHLWARICAVADVFEAITSFRPYRSPMPRKKAVEILERDSGKAFDPKVLACWLKITDLVWKS